MNSKKISALALSIFVLLNSGCSQGEEDKRVQPDDIVRTYQASCDYKYTEGAEAPDSLLPEKITKTYFDKILDENKIRPLLDVSGEQTVKFAKLTGVQFYKTTFYAQKSCPYTEALPQAPADVGAIFDSIGDSLLGLYLPIKNRNLQTVDDQAAILVRIDSDRWTLMHEYMHHLFNTVRNATGVGKTDQQIRSELEVNFAIYDKLNSSNKSNEISIIVEQSKYLSLAGEGYVEMLKRFTLEEVTIETYLSDKYDRDQFSYVSAETRLGAAGYARDSASRVFESDSMFVLIYKQTKKSIDKLSKSTEQSAVAMTKQLKEDIKKYDKLMNEIQPLFERANRYVELHGTRANRLAGAVPMKATKAHKCSHSPTVHLGDRTVQF
jgi:hypothetical protein